MRLFFQVLLWIACGGFAVLTGVAAVSQLRSGTRREASLAMLAGAVLFLAAVVCGILSLPMDWLLAVAGSVLVFCSAFYNGRKSGEFHPRHHVIRLGLCALLTVGFILL